MELIGINTRDALREKMEYFLQEQGFSLKKKFHCLNPAHNDVHPSMSYNPRNYTVHCFSCNATYDIFSLIGLLFNKPTFSEQYQFARERFGQASFHYKGTTQNRDYFYKRGLSDEICDKYGLFLKGNRAFIPIREDGAIISTCSRSLDGSDPRYLNSKGKMGIFGKELLFLQGISIIFICEGIFDALSLELLGCKAIALCGVSGGEKLLISLGELHKETLFILAGDLDTAGQRMNRDLSERLTDMGYRAEVFNDFSPYKDINEAFVADRSLLKRKIEAITSRPKVLKYASCADHLQGILSKLSSSVAARPFSTGFFELDRQLGGGLKAGLYVLGAISSLGKTSFVLQIADFLAGTGKAVLFFSLEMSREELVCKTLSRKSYISRETHAITAFEILTGQYEKEEFQDIFTEYESHEGKNVCILESEGSNSSESIASHVRAYIEETGEIPVVFVDYLQLMSAVDIRGTERQNIDKAVWDFKKLSRTYKTPVVVISSFNRDNYKNTVGMESFKESGAVEYSADVLLGLQLAGVGGSGFDINKEKLKDPREVELVILKNRNGTPYAKIPLAYLPKFNLFCEKSVPRVGLIK